MDNPVDLINQAKNIGAVLGTASVIAYVSGYLALRARAFSLGTDPAFKLVDEAYVFAGFRFLFITLIVLLLSAPVILLVRSGAMWVARNMPLTILQPIQWLLLVALAIMTVMGLRMILSANGVLLQAGPLGESNLTDAILGGGTKLRVIITFAIVVLAALSALWLKGRLASARGPFEWLLAMVVALQIVMLPIYHGALFADRRVRVLAASPDTVQGLVGPLGIVDRTSDHVTLLGLDGEGNRRLTTIELGDMNGIPIREVVTLRHFIGEVLGANPKQARASDSVPDLRLTAADSSGQADGGQTMAPGGTDLKRGFFSSLVDYLGITFDAIGALGDSVVDFGELWMVDLDASGRPSERRRIGTFDDLAWPVTGPDRTFYALQRGRVVQFDAEGGSLQVLGGESTWSKLLGVLADGTILGLVRHSGEIRPGVLRPGGELDMRSSPLAEEEKAAVARLMQETRSHTGGRTLLVERSERGGRGFDVFLRTRDEIFNLSDCGDDACGQASLSPDFRRVLFIRQPRH